MAMALVACGEMVTIQPNEVGFEISSSGVNPEIINPGATRLDFCGPGEACASLLRVEASKSSASMTITRVFLPKSNVDLENVTAGIQFRIKNTPEALRQVASEVRSVFADDRQSTRERKITSDAIYEVYIKRVVSGTIIDALKQYTVEETLSEVVLIGNYVKNEVNLALAETPVEVTELTFTNGIGTVPDEVITAKRKLYAIDENKERQIRALAAEISVEDKRQAFQKVRNLNDIKNAKQAGVPYDVYVSLKIEERRADALEKLADAANSSAEEGNLNSVMMYQ
jgi:hypothetical protein